LAIEERGGAFLGAGCGRLALALAVITSVVVYARSKPFRRARFEVLLEEPDPDRRADVGSRSSE